MGYWTTPKWVFEEGDIVKLNPNSIVWVNGYTIKVPEGRDVLAKVVGCDSNPDRWHDEIEVELNTIYGDYGFTLEAQNLTPVDMQTTSSNEIEDGMYALTSLIYTESCIINAGIVEDEERKEYERLKKKYG